MIVTVVVHYRGLPDTRRCLRSLQTVHWANHRTIVIDNCSGDGSGERLSHEFPECEVIQLDRNLGYAGGNNHGMRKAIAMGASFVQILNPDVEICEPGYLNRLVESMGQNPTWGIVGPRVYFHDVESVQKTWSEEPTLGRLLRGYEKQEESQMPPEHAPQEPMAVDVVNGVCFLARTELLEQMGGFEASYFMYGEEIDLCTRARGAGWLCAHIPVPSIIHHSNLGGRPFDLSHNLSRSSFVRYFRRHSGWLSATLLFSIYLARAIPKCFRSHRPGFGHYVSSLMAALFLWPAGPPKSRRNRA